MDEITGMIDEVILRLGEAQTQAFALNRVALDREPNLGYLISEEIRKARETLERVMQKREEEIARGLS